jgi:uncharacterized membrane protein
MASNVSKKIRTALILSLIMNLAFFTGFVVKKINSSQTSVKAVCNTIECEGESVSEQHEVGYHHFCKRSGFREMFDAYRNWHRKTSLKMSQIKTAYLRELKKENADPAAIKTLIEQMNRTAVQLNEENYRHLSALKEVLPAQEFSALMDCMAHSLNAHRSHSSHSQPEPCTGTHNHREHAQNR